MSSSSYPACFPDDWVISVGGNNSSGGYHSDAMFGKDMDLIAPYGSNNGSGDVHTLKHDGNRIDDYGNFWGTSSSAPHVSGVAALILSEFNGQSPLYEDLAPEDVEHLLQNYATQVPSNPCNGVVPSEHCGWGMMNAKTTMEHIDYPKYRIDHYPKPMAPGNYSIQTVATNVDIQLNDVSKGLPRGLCKGDVINVSATYSHNLRQGDQLLDGWVRTSASTGYYPYTLLSQVPVDVPAAPGARMTSVPTTTSVDLLTRVYKITEDANGNPVSPAIYYPDAPSNILMGYSVHLYDPLATEADFYTEIEEKQEESYFRLFPNPTEGLLQLRYQQNHEAAVDVFVQDISGRRVQSFGQQTLSHQGSLSLQLTDLPAGLYFLVLKGQSVNTLRFVKANR
ncbi:S8 family peptidase [bacterium SCSIO 12741]|nr:S8 family peptidase [bacterium SCSIO 12741]